MMTLQDIAAGQQALVNKAQGRSGSKPAWAGSPDSPHPLEQGKFSFDSNPVTPPWDQMPDGGIPGSWNGTINIPAIGAGFVDVIGPAAIQLDGSISFFQVPNGFDGVIEDLVCFYNGGGFVNGSGALVWRVLIDGQAARNYDKILVQFGVAPFNGKTRIRIKSNQTIQFQVKNVSLGGGGTQIYCQFVGWLYPCKLS